MLKARHWPILLCLTLFAVFPATLAAQAAETDESADKMQKLTQESSNPVGSLWMITNQFNINLMQSPRGRLFRYPKAQFNYNFQPVLTFDLSTDYRLIARPLLPIYNSPYPSSRIERDPRFSTRADHRIGQASSISLNESVDYAFGLGDAQFMAMVSPATSTSGFVFGAGPTAVFPTATDKHLGDGKWQLGAAAAAVYMNERWVAGVFPQQWWSVAGDASRKEVSLTKAQYFLWYSPIPTWQVGMAPNVVIDWTQKHADDALTLPVGLGVAKLVTLGKLPLKISVEADYSIIRPRHASDEWTFKFTLTPILPKLF